MIIYRGDSIHSGHMVFMVMHVDGVILYQMVLDVACH